MEHQWEVVFWWVSCRVSRETQDRLKSGKRVSVTHVRDYHQVQANPLVPVVVGYRQQWTVSLNTGVGWVHTGTASKVRGVDSSSSENSLHCWIDCLIHQHLSVTEASHSFFLSVFGHATGHGGNLRSLTRDGTCDSCIGSLKSQPLDRQEHPRTVSHSRASGNCAESVREHMVSLASLSNWERLSIFEPSMKKQFAEEMM